MDCAHRETLERGWGETCVDCGMLVEPFGGIANAGPAFVDEPSELKLREKWAGHHTNMRQFIEATTKADLEGSSTCDHTWEPDPARFAHRCTLCGAMKDEWSEEAVRAQDEPFAGAKKDVASIFAPLLKNADELEAQIKRDAAERRSELARILQRRHDAAIFGPYSGIPVYTNPHASDYSYYCIDARRLANSARLVP